MFISGIKRNLLALLTGTTLFLPGSLCAGGGPETTLLVVNQDSPLSQRIANEYVRLRDIPPNHVLWLRGIPSSGSISIARFRQEMLKPIGDFIQSNGLQKQIDTIVYSADFPYRVNFSSDLKKSRRAGNKLLGKFASTTSLTYFFRRVMSEDIGYLGLNHYFRSFPGPKIQSIKAPISATQLDEKQIKELRKASHKALRQKAWDKSIAINRKLLDSHPQSAENWFEMARAFAASGKVQESVDALSNAVDLGWSNSLSLQRDGYFAALRDRSDFIALIERIENFYQPILDTHGFSNQYVWSSSDLTFWEASDIKDQYFLSTMLAYTGARGNSYAEVMNYLERSGASDGTHPDGTVYLMENNNIRSKTRQPLFTATINELIKRGRKGEILNRGISGQTGLLPMGKEDIIGVVVGSAAFDWQKTGSKLLPGAIAESLTSYGGDFNRSAQTKLTEFLRQGAAGSSGAVTEPYALQLKFPVPLLHTNYADGCSLAEAFYQSIEYPYQLIIVGDPLARPFARFVEPYLQHYDASKPWSGTVTLQPAISTPGSKTPKAFELWINGIRRATSMPGVPIQVDTTQLADGHHNVRLVAIENSSIETRSYTSFTAKVNNGDVAIEIDRLEPNMVYGESIEISGSAPDGTEVRLLQGHRELGNTTTKKGRWRISTPTKTVGLGPIALEVKAQLADGRKYRTALKTNIIEPAREPAQTMGPRPSEGINALLYDARGATRKILIKKLNGRLGIRTKSGEKWQRVDLDGYLHIPVAGFYQLIVKAQGAIRLSVNERIRLDAVVGKYESERFLPLSLEAGWHRLKFEMDASNRVYLSVALSGNQPLQMLGGNRLGHLQSDQSQ